MGDSSIKAAIKACGITGTGSGYLALTAAALLVTARSFAGPPTVEHLFPAGFSLDSTNEMTVAGKLDPWPPKVWVSCPGITLTPSTNKSRFNVVVGPDSPVGAHLLRLYNEEGASAPRILVISERQELLESEPNDTLEAAQPVPRLPMTINGRLNKTGDVDSFAVTLAAGQWLEARVDAYTLASKMDALLRLTTSDGVQQAWNHDFTSLDPRLSWQARSNGIYIVQLMAFKYPADSEVRFTGGDGCVYRLHLASLAQAPDLIPGGQLEREPNNTPATAPLLKWPATLRGAINCPGDEDCFGFTVNQGENVELSLEAASLGSPLDAWLKIVDAQGKELARHEDISRFHDPRLEWKAPANGTFYAVVGNLVHFGGDSYAYRLTARQLGPDFSARAAASSITLAAGETNDLKISVTRLRGFDAKLTAAMEGLPPGTHAQPLDVPEKGGELTLKLIADPDAKPAQAPVRIIITDPATTQTRPVPFSLVSSSEDNGVPGGYTSLLVESTDQLWLTVTPKAQPPVATAK